MSILQNCLKAFSFVGVISILNIAAPVWAANYIKLKIQFADTPEQEALVPIAELERFAETGKSEDLPDTLHNGVVSIETLYKQLNRPISVDPNEPLGSQEDFLLGFLSPPLSEEERKVASKLIAGRANGKKLITFLKTLPVDTITEDNFLPSLRAYRPKEPITLFQSSVAPLGMGTPLYSNGGELTINVLGSGAAFTSSLYLNYQYIASNRQAGAVINLDPIPAGQELVFGLYVHNTGYWYYTGNPRRNPDHLHHARVNYLSPGVVQVGFEDQLWGGDLNFADHNFRFFGINTLPQLLNIQSATTVRRGEFFDFYASAYDWETPQGLSFAWDFNGDGQIDYEGAEGPTHWNYGKKGIYNSKVTVTDASGSIAEYTFETEVVPEPTAVGGLLVLGLFGFGKMASRKRKGA